MTEEQRRKILDDCKESLDQAARGEVKPFYGAMAEIGIVRPKSLAGLFEEAGTWAVDTFTQATPASWCKHLTKEVVEELTPNPSSTEEMSDVLILIAGLARKQGISVDELTAAMAKKLAINKTRVWGEPDADGVVEHVRDGVL